MSRLRISLALVLAAFFLNACADYSSAPMSQAIAARYESNEPAYIEILTMVNNGSNSGEHTGILINGSQTVLWDPAGSFRHPDMPRRQDVFYGATPRMADYYKRFHARSDYRVIVQRVPVSLEEANTLIALAEARGATPQLFCSRAASDVLNDLPTFSAIKVSFFPDNILNTVAKIPGVQTSVVREEDVGQNYVDLPNI